MSEDRPWYRDPRLVVARRDVASLSREKTIVLALLIQLFVAAFSSFLVVGLTSLYDPGSVSTGEVEMAVTGEAHDALLDAAREQEGSNVVHYENPNEAKLAFQEGRVDALLQAEYVDSAASDGRRVAVTARVPEGSIRSTLIVVEVRRVLNTLERQVRTERADSLDAPPVPLPSEVAASPYFGFTYTVLIPLLLFLPPFISGSVAVDTVTEEMERGTLELLRVAPVSLVDIVDGKALGMVLIAPLQALLWVALLTANGIPVSNVSLLLLFVTAIAVVVVTLGVTLGVSMQRRRPAQLLYSVLTLVVFGAAVVLPEHPTTTVAKLAVDSPTLLTYGHVFGSVALAVAAYAVARRYVAGVNADAL
ncbi:ABC transporter permease [Haloarcula amylovorans]|uniref:ABC transporter permease n=1 Tax=Haloarcula amylovorans TaxID=2562280 RepID=UPI001075DFFF|nr:ABC transporter permease [Halomicroarcula amylolytica]